MVEVWNSTSLFLKDLRALLKEIEARIQNLASVIVRILALLHDCEHGVHSELIAAATQRFRVPT